MSLMLSAQQKAQIQQQTGKNPDEMTNDELDEAITTAGIDLPDEEPDFLDEPGNSPASKRRVVSPKRNLRQKRSS